jgi:tRNA(fMet)-specific endonuclease VapC
VRYLLDTDHVSLLQQPHCREYGPILGHLVTQPPADVVHCAVSFQEQAIGAHSRITRARTAAELLHGYRLPSVIHATFATRTRVPFDAPALAVFDQLAAAKVRVKTMDLRIAAIALANGLVLVTRNTSDFVKVPGLTTEDWTR